MRKLPFADGLREQSFYKTVRAAPISTFANFTTEPASRVSLTERAVEHRLEIGLRQWVNSELVDVPEAMDKIRKDGIKVLMHHVYGPISEEIYQIIELLYADGRFESEPCRRLLALIPILDGAE